jgi:hypothetical protein
MRPCRTVARRVKTNPDRGVAMTLVLGLSAHTFALQVGDRKLTKGTRQHDPDSNKSILMLGTDGFICISYSGLAYLKGKNTDQVIAEHLAQFTARPGVRPNSSATAFGAPTARHVGPGIERLKAFVTLDFTKLASGQDRPVIQLLVTGFLGKPTPDGRRVRPYLGRFEHRVGRQSKPTFIESTRHFQKGRTGWKAEIGQVHEPEVAGFHAYVNSPAPKIHTDVQETMRLAIERTSVVNHGVGPNCMSILMSRWGHIEVIYMPQPSTDTPASSHTHHGS